MHARDAASPPGSAVPCRHCGRSGFTLIELMITVAILGVVLALALPTYQSHQQTAQRREAATTLLKAQVFLEQYRSIHNRYPLAAEAATVLPASLKQVPATGTALYTITLVGSGQAYTLSAAPTGSMKDDGCGQLTLDHLGQRNAIPPSATAGKTGTGSGMDRCWP